MSLQFHLHKEKQIRKTSGSIYGNTMSRLLARSYEEISAFAHAYYMPGQHPGQQRPCYSYNAPTETGERITTLHGVMGIDFDNEGKYIASVERNGCLTVHDFEVLYRDAQQRNMQDLSEGVDNQVNHRCHVDKLGYLLAIKWNPYNQHEVVLTSGSKLVVYNVDDKKPVSELKTNPGTAFHYSSFTNIAVAKTKSMISVSDMGGTVGLWDPKVGNQTICKLSTNDRIFSVQFDVQDQYVFAAGEKGIVYMWDIRTAAGNVSGPPLVSWELPLESMRQERHKTYEMEGISSILFNPSSPSMLSFYTINRWSGILDTLATDNFQMTHIHELPQNKPDYRNKPSWLPACSVYVAPLSNGIRLLDFNSPRCVDHREAIRNRNNHNYQDVICSQDIISTAAHPFYNAILAGTERGSLIMISQKRSSHEGEEV